MARQMTLRACLVAVCLMLASGGGLAVRAAHATVLLYLPFEAQSRTASRVFVGEVQAVVSRPCFHAPEYFETLVTFAVEQVVAGVVPPVVELRFSGGEVGDLKQWIEGMPEFAEGESYVVFQYPDQEPPLVSPIVGFNQGLYRVVTGAAGEDVVRDRRGRTLAAPAVGSARRAAAGTEPRLDEFVAAVRAARR